MGFKNAPDINEYKRGMRINYGGEKNGEWWTVAWVAEDGKARAYNSNKSPGAFPLDSMPDVTLDLASIWEGQERWGHGGGKAVVRMADSEFLLYNSSNSDCPRLCRLAEFVSIFPHISDPALGISDGGSITHPQTDRNRPTDGPYYWRQTMNEYKTEAEAMAAAAWLNDEWGPPCSYLREAFIMAGTSFPTTDLTCYRCASWRSAEVEYYKAGGVWRVFTPSCSRGL